MLLRSAMHQAGATVLTELLQFSAPTTEQRIVPCSCGHSAHYRELRSKPVLTVVGIGGGIASLLLVSALPCRPIPRRRRTGHREYGVLSRRAPHAGGRGPGVPPSITGASR